MELLNEKYVIGGIPVKELAEKYGSPLYIYDSAKMESQLSRLTKAFNSAPVKINYACKALTNVNILKIFKKLGTGLDTVSIQEVRLGLMAGFNPLDIIFTPNCVDLSEISEAVGLGVKINIDSLSILDKFGVKYGRTQPACIRIKPNVMGGGHKKISTGHIDSKFGISIEDIDRIHETVARHKMKIEGLHLHTGSDILDIEAFVKSADVMFETAKHFKDLEYIDFGGGFKVPYKQDDYSTDIEYLGQLFSKHFIKFCKDYGRELKLYLEPGKFLISEAGYFVTQVNVIKLSKNTTFACINSGLNHLIRPMFYDAYHHITNISKPHAPRKIYSVVGYICETDTFAWNRELNEVEEGDYLVFHNAGAYCFSMVSNYNSRLQPAEVLICKGKDYLIRERQTFDDLLRNQVIQTL